MENSVNFILVFVIQQRALLVPLILFEVNSKIISQFLVVQIQKNYICDFSFKNKSCSIRDFEFFTGRAVMLLIIIIIF